VGDISLVHELKTLCDWLTDIRGMGTIQQYFTYLGKKGNEFPERLDLGLIEWAQEGENHQLLRVRQL